MAKEKFERSKARKNIGEIGNVKGNPLERDPLKRIFATSEKYAETEKSSNWDKYREIEGTPEKA